MKTDSSSLFLIVAGATLAGFTALTLSCSDATCEESGTCAPPGLAPNDGGSSSGTSGSSGGGDGDAAIPVGDFDLTATAPPSILVGTTGEVDVKVTRTGARSITGAVTVTLESQSNLTAQSVTIPADATSAKLSIAVAANRKHGDPRLVIKGVAGDKTSEARPPTLIRGLPGSLDTSFGADGTYTFDKPTSEATGVVIQPDGKVVIGGKAGGDLALVRLSDEGVVDATFNGGGVAIKPPGTGIVSTSDIVLDKSGAVAILYSATNATGNTTSAVLRVTSNGALDPVFGPGGVASVSVDLPSALAIDATGNLFVGGKRSSTQPGQYVVKLLPGGAPDTAWGGGTGFFFSAGPGACVGGASPDNCRTRAVIVEPGGTLLACQNRNDGAHVHRITAAGTAGNLYAFTSLLLDVCNSLAPHATQDYAYAAGNDQSELVVRRLLAGGTTDTPWGNDQGQYRGDNTLPLKAARRIANVDGKLVVAGEASTRTEIGIARFTSLGALDTTFTSAGFVKFQVGGKASTPSAMAIDSANGRVVVAGSNGNLIAARVWL